MALKRLAQELEPLEREKWVAIQVGGMCVERRDGY
jgi:hypothetical protein